MSPRDSENKEQVEETGSTTSDKGSNRFCDELTAMDPREQKRHSQEMDARQMENVGVTSKLPECEIIASIPIGADQLAVLLKNVVSDSGDWCKPSAWSKSADSEHDMFDSKYDTQRVSLLQRTGESILKRGV